METPRGVKDTVIPLTLSDLTSTGPQPDLALSFLSASHHLQALFYISYTSNLLHFSGPKAKHALGIL